MSGLGPVVPPPKRPDPPEWERVPDKPHLERHRVTGMLRTCPTWPFMAPKGTP